MARTVPIGAKGVDASFARPPATRLVELGYDFLVGYLSVAPSSPKKNLTKADCDVYLPYVFLLLVWEMSATRANLGATYGTLDGANAKYGAAALGQPKDVPILVADDTNTTAVNVAQQEAYMRAFAKACAPYPIGIYGDVDILYRCSDLWQIGWLPNAWSWSGGSRAIAEATAKALGAHVLQHTGFYIDNTWAVDPDDVIRPFPAWGLGQDPQPFQGDDDMQVATFEVEGLPGVYMWAPGMPAPVPFTNIPDFQALAASLGSAGNGTKITKDMYDRLFVPVPTPAAPAIDYNALASAIAPLLPTTFDGSIHLSAAG